MGIVQRSYTMILMLLTGAGWSEQNPFCSQYGRCARDAALRSLRLEQLVRGEHFLDEVGRQLLAKEIAAATEVLGARVT